MSFRSLFALYYSATHWDDDSSMSNRLLITSSRGDLNKKEEEAERTIKPQKKKIKARSLPLIHPASTQTQEAKSK